MTAPAPTAGPLVASCHCGAVRLRVPAAPGEVTDCNCSICGRLGVLWTYYQAEEVHIEAAPGATRAYVWGDRCIAFHHCATCGCTTHYVGADDPTTGRVAVNARLLPLDAAAPATVRRLDGATSWRVVDRATVWPWPVD